MCQQPGPECAGLEILQGGIAIQSSVIEVASDLKKAGGGGVWQQQRQQLRV